MTLLDDMLALLPDNSSGDISAEDMRTIVTDLYNAAQPVDSDLTTIAGLTATTNNFLQAKSSAWASRTPTQAAADLQSLITIAESQVTNLTTDLAGKQPLDSDLTTIAALTATTDSIMQAKAGAWSARTITQLLVDLAAAGTTFQPLDSDLTAIAAIAPANDDIVQRKAGAWTNRTVAQLSTDLGIAAGYQPLDSDLTTIAGLTATTDSFMQAKSSAWSARTVAQVLVDLAAAGTTFQPLDSDLTTIAALTATTDNFIVSVASAWASRTPAQVKTTLAIAESDVSGLVTDLGNKQPLDSDLTTIAALTATTDSFMQAKGSAWSARTVAQVLVDLAAAGTTFQPLDSDLTTIAGLTATTDSVMQAKGSAWSARTLAQLMTDLAALGTTFQPLDSDLTTIAGLTATTDNFLQSKSSAWASRTAAQVSTDLQAAGLAPKASPALTGTATIVNVTQSGRTLRTYTVLTDAATIAVDASLGDHFTVTLGGNRTLGNPTNPPSAGQDQMLFFAIRQDGTGTRTLALDTNYRFGTDITSITLSTAINKTDYLGVRYNVTDTKWDVIAFVKGY